MIQADRNAFDGYGVLYYPVTEDASEMGHVDADDQDMAWALTCAANLDGTAYALDGASVLALAAYRHVTASSHMAPQIDPAFDIRRLVPDVTAAPMYPDFPEQVMEISEARFRLDQLMHYMSTYGVEEEARRLGLDVTVSRGWMPDAESTGKTEHEQVLADRHIVRVVLSRSAMRAIAFERLSRATRMHAAELAVVADVMRGCDVAAFPKVAFHENMLGIVAAASDGSSSDVEHACACLCSHPADVLRAARYVVSEKGRLATRQKKGFCRALERWDADRIAHDLADASAETRVALDYLSVARFGGESLRRAKALLDSREVRSWASALEDAWAHRGDGFSGVIAKYEERPGVLLRSMTRLVKSGCPVGEVRAALMRHVSDYSLPTLVRTLTIFCGTDDAASRDWTGADTSTAEERERAASMRAAYAELVPALRAVLKGRLVDADVPIRGKRVFVDDCGISEAGSVLMPNDSGDTGTAWPPAGIAYSLPEHGRMRFFTFWNDDDKRVDVDLHFRGQKTDGSPVDVGWNRYFRSDGMSLVFSGDVTTSHNSVEYLDVDLDRAEREGVDTIYQRQHIYCGAESWGGIAECRSGATLVGSTDRDVVLYDGANLLFRDEMTGDGNEMDYALIDVPGRYVRILRGARMPFRHTSFTLGSFVDALLSAKAAVRVDDAGEADVTLALGRTDDESAISLADMGYLMR